MKRNGVLMILTLLPSQYLDRRGNIYDIHIPSMSQATRFSHCRSILCTIIRSCPISMQLVPSLKIKCWICGSRCNLWIPFETPIDDTFSYDFVKHILLWHAIDAALEKLLIRLFSSVN